VHCLDKYIPCSREARAHAKTHAGLHKARRHSFEPLKYDFLLYDQHIMALDGALGVDPLLRVFIMLYVFTIGGSAFFVLSDTLQYDRFAQRMATCYQVSKIFQRVSSV
jgi:hypothetical protein